MLELEELTIKNEVEIYNKEDECIGKLGAGKTEIYGVDYKSIKYNELTYHIIVCPSFSFNKEFTETVYNNLKNDGYDGTLYYTNMPRGHNGNEDAENRVYEVSVYRKYIQGSDKKLGYVKIKKYNNIPNLPLETVKKIASYFTHLVRGYECDNTVMRAKYYEAELPDDLENIAFTWDPIDRKTRDMSLSEYKELEPICKVVTLHEWAYYGFFKPTAAEVFSQLPECLDAKKMMIETCVYEHPTKPHFTESIIDDYHIAITTVYEYLEPKEKESREPKPKEQESAEPQEQESTEPQLKRRKVDKS